MLYSYPCLIHQENDNSYNVIFIDLASGIIPATNKDDAIDAAYYALIEMLKDEEDFPRDKLPKPSNICDLKLDDLCYLYFKDKEVRDSFLFQVEVDLDDYADVSFD